MIQSQPSLQRLQSEGDGLAVGVQALHLRL